MKMDKTTGVMDVFSVYVLADDSRRVIIDCKIHVWGEFS